MKWSPQKEAGVAPSHRSQRQRSAVQNQRKQVYELQPYGQLALKNQNLFGTTFSDEFEKEIQERLVQQILQLEESVQFLSTELKTSHGHENSRERLHAPQNSVEKQESCEKGSPPVELKEEEEIPEPIE